MKGRNIQLLWALFIFMNYCALGQTIKTSFERITGLSQSAGNYIIQDQKGFIWVATYGGLNKFDGYSFKYYLHDIHDSTSLTYEGLIFLFEDHAGYIWALNNSRQIGLDRYDPNKDRFYHFKFDEEDSLSLSSNYNSQVMEDQYNQIWICNDNALNLVKPLENEDYSKIYFQRYYYPESIIGLNGSGFSYVYEDQHDSLLLFSQELYYFDRKTKRYIDANLNLDIALATSIVELGDGSLWIGTSANGVKRITYDYSISSYRLDPCPTLGIFENDYTFLISDDENNIWIGSETKGLFKFDPHLDLLEHFPYDEHDPNSISENSVHSLFIDRTGVLWVGTMSQELSKTDLNSKKFIHYHNIPGNPNSLSENLIGGISGIKPEELWVGSRKDGGVNRFIFSESEQTKVIRYHYDPEDPNTIGGNHTLSLVQRKNGEVWLGSVGEIISQIIPGDIAKGSKDIIQRYFVQGWTFSVYEDSDSILWGGTWNEGLWRLNDKDKSFIKFYHDPNDSLSLCDNIIWSIGEDSHKNLWIGSNGQGMSILTSEEKNSENPRFINYRSQLNNLKGISHNTINIFYQDKAGTMWIGTNGGLNRVVKQNDSEKSYNLNKLKFVSYTVNDGLPSNSVVGILEDKKGNLWLSTTKGLSVFDFSDSTFINYYKSDGLQSDVFVHNASFKDANGKMYMGGTNGFNAFHPEEIVANPYIPEVVFTDFKVWNKSVRVGESVNNDVLFSESINDIEKIELSHKNDVFTIDFAALHFAQPHENQYAYYLEGFEEDWNYSEDQRSATYTNLDPGTYVFKVKGSNNNGIWNETGTSLTIEVLPHWTGTWWFRILLVFFIAGLVFLFLYLRTRNLVYQKAVLEKKVDARTEQLNKLIQELQEKQDEVEATNEELTSTLEDLFTQKSHVEKINGELKETQAELKKINNQLDLRVQERTTKLVKANQELDRFVYSASHDLSAPLKSIMGLINIATLENKRTDLSNHLQHMKKSVNKLENVIKSLTQYSRNTGHEIRNQEFLLNALIDEVLEEILGPSRNNKIQIIRDFEQNQTLTSDYLRIKIVMTNLISNAIKYGNNGNSTTTIHISLSQTEKENIIIVKDNGMGIEEEHMDRIFDMFYRASTLSNGSGLGLYIVKETIEKLNGKIKVESNKDEFTEVVINLPRG